MNFFKGMIAKKRDTDIEAADELGMSKEALQRDLAAGDFDDGFLKRGDAPEPPDRRISEVASAGIGVNFDDDFEDDDDEFEAEERRLAELEAGAYEAELDDFDDDDDDDDDEAKNDDADDAIG